MDRCFENFSRRRILKFDTLVDIFHIHLFKRGMIDFLNFQNYSFVYSNLNIHKWDTLIYSFKAPDHHLSLASFIGDVLSMMSVRDTSNSLLC